MVVVIHIIGSDKHIAMLSSAVIIIYGAGEIAERIAGKLNSNGIDYAGFIVSNRYNNYNVYCGRKVVGIDELVPSQSLGVILGMNINNIASVIPNLQEIGFNYFDITPYYCMQTIG